MIDREFNDLKQNDQPAQPPQTNIEERDCGYFKDGDSA